MNTIQEFFTQFDALPEQEQNVQQFLTQEITQKCGISSEESEKIIQQISESLTQFEANHKELMECEKNGISEKRWLQQKLDETAKVTNIPQEKVREAFTALVNREHQASIEELAGEKLDLTQVPEETGPNQQLTENVEAIHQTTFFQMGLTAQGMTEADSFINSPTMKKALESDYFSPEEHKAKKIAAAAIYADSRQTVDNQKEISGIPREKILDYLPEKAALGGARGISSAKAVYKIAEEANQNGNHQKVAEAQTYLSSGIAAGYEFAIKNVCGKIGAYTGEAAGNLLNFIGIPVPPEATKFVGRMAGHLLGDKIPHLKETTKQMAEKTVAVAKTIVQKVKSTVSAVGQKLVSTARSVMSSIKKKWTETTSKVKSAIASWFGF